MASVSAMMKQNNARKAEKALKDILDKADGNGNGRVELTDFIDILEMNGVEVICCVKVKYKIPSPHSG